MENQLTISNPTPAMLLDKAIEKGIDIEQLEKLMGLQERWDAQQARKAFNNAMSDFQKAKPDIIKNKSGYDNRYQYATLNSIQKQVDPVLSDCGLSYRWDQEIKEGKIVVSCIATHIDGHSEKTTLEAPFDKSGSKNEIQAMGSSNSYLFRYTLCAMFGISSDEDNDGKTAPDAPKKPGVTAPKNQAPEKSVDDLHKEYMKLYNQYLEAKGENEASKYHPDNWSTERTIKTYSYALKTLKKLVDEIN